MSKIVPDPEAAEALPAGTIVMDVGGLYALKVKSGAWMYEDGKFWEPEFPARVVALVEED